ncbi:MAG: hypothetical protein K0S32_1736 [Bacteroidetes bacterium]|nr:hypothetical protein [Bacteroidota bacterium]
MFIGTFCAWAFLKILRQKTPLATQWSFFFLMIGLSSLIGSMAHGAHFQLGETFFRTTVFVMNAVSLIAIYFCFKAANTYFSLGRKEPNKMVSYGVIAWIAILLVLTFIQGNFLLIKIHAGIVLTYSLIVHIITHRKGRAGSGYIAGGILISFLSIVVHSIKLSAHEYFNYKDISHIIMLISLMFIYKGAMIILKNRKA